MSDKIEITVKVNGKDVPLSSVSDETFAFIKKEEEQLDEKNAPVFSKQYDRLIVKLNPSLIKTMRGILKDLDKKIGDIQENSFVSFCPDGLLGTDLVGSSWAEARKFYLNQDPEPIFRD